MNMNIKKLIAKRIILTIILLFICCIIAYSFKRFYNLKEAEDNYIYSPIEYSYDSINDTLPATCALRQNDFTAQSVVKEKDHYFATFDDTYFGTVEILFPEPLSSEEKITITVGELSNGDNVWTRQNNDSGYSGHDVSYYSDTVTLSKGTESYLMSAPERSRINKKIYPAGWQGGITPFKYCSIEGYDGQLDEDNVIQKAVFYNFDDNKFLFKSNNETLNQVNDLCKQTLKATTYSGYFVDGFREITPYELDAYINELGWFSVSDDPQICQNTVNYLLEHHTWPTEWISYTIFLAYEYYMETGDIEYIKSIYPKLEKCLWYNETNKSGLVDSSKYGTESYRRLGVHNSDIIDWPESERDDFARVRIADWKSYIKHTIRGIWNWYNYCIARIGHLNYMSEVYYGFTQSDLNARYQIASPNSVVNAVYYQSLIYLTDIAKACGFDEDSIHYEQKAKDLKKAYQASFIKNGKVIDAVASDHCSLQASVFALDFGLVPDEDIGKVVEFIESKGMDCSVFVSQFLLEALCKNGQADQAVRYIGSKSDTSWYGMISNTGSGLATEAWNFEVKPDMDLNHAWATAPINVTKRYLIGIQPELPGYSVTAFKPELFSLEYLSSSVPTHVGDVTIDYRRKNNRCYIELDIPQNIKLDFKLSEYTIFKSCNIDGANIDINNNVIIDSGNHVIELVLSEKNMK